MPYACKRPLQLLGQLGAAVITVATLSIMATGALGAQEVRWPDSPRNLRVLPPGTAGPRLGAFMIGFADALGVTCEYCHVGSGTDYAHYDFPADDKTTKRRARVMLQMVRLINDSVLSGLPSDPADTRTRVRVACITCHRGQPRPVLLEDLLDQMTAEHGVDSAAARYQDLRTRYYGGFTYDFTTGPLTRFGNRLMTRGDTTGAIKFLDMEIRLNGGSFTTYFSYGRALAAVGRQADAIEALTKGASLAPPGIRPAFERELAKLRAP